MKKYTTYIGIDAGVNTGVAIWETKPQAFLSIVSVPIHKAMQIVSNMHKSALGSVLVRVEDARLRKFFVKRKGDTTMLQGVGSVKRDCKIWEDFLTDESIPFEMVAPMNNRTKLKAEAFHKITKWEHSTNEHSRDAAMLVFKK